MPDFMLYRTDGGAVVCHLGACYRLQTDWSELVNDEALHDRLADHCRNHAPETGLAVSDVTPLAPLDTQELWAAGVTYRRSRQARMDESREAGGGDFYDRVYAAERPELFLKATPHRVVGPGQRLHLRSDSRWMVPEPELVLAITRRGTIVGCTVGNDLSCRDIEGENPLYLPQAKTFDRCAAIGPGLLVAPRLPGPETAIHLVIRREGSTVFEGATRLGEMKRSPGELVDFLFRDNAHPHGCLLMTGTGIVPGDEVALAPGDEMDITIDGIGTLSNSV